VVGANPSVRPVILAASHTPRDVLLALEAGAFGFLNQNIPSKQLVKSLELVALGQTVIHHHSHLTAVAQPATQSHPMRAPAVPLALPAIEKWFSDFYTIQLENYPVDMAYLSRAARVPTTR
jgi:DNA-binding NarL/FixJ family response regulator